ncbi:MAG: hypothetical protein R6U29_10415 [Desulfosudaceae bacterium]
MILYLNLCQPVNKTNGLRNLIDQKMPGNMQALYNIEDLQKRIQGPTFNIDIVIIHVGADSPIHQLLEFKNDLKDLSVVLVLHNVTSDKDIDKLLKLYPRYMTFGDDYHTIISVLENRLAFKKRQLKNRHDSA